MAFEKFKDFKFRQWLYGVIAAGFLVASGYGLIANDQVNLWLRFAEASLNLIPVAGLTLAAANARPSVRDEISGE